MCGIAGIASRPGFKPDPARLRAMADALRHRGPDGEGMIDGGAVALAHLRLSIVDLAHGAQPLQLGPIALVANGEIYNDAELRTRYPDLHFRTGSDCEPPLALWPREGLTYANALRGMYAIGLINRIEAAGRLILTRDPFGIKPLYLAQDDEGIAFASEPAALLVAGYGERAVRPEARDALLALQFTPGTATIYPGIERVPPGATLDVAGGGITGRHVRAPVSFGGDKRLTDEAEALRRLDEALLDSVVAHERADVPFGLFLSGGVDSSAILTAMKKGGLARPLAWTARFDGDVADESQEAARIARLVGAEHRIVTIDRAQVFRDLPKIVAAMDDPVADYAIIPTWFLGRAARDSVKVILSGEGGDELFAGYGRYRRASRPWWRGGRAPWQKAALRGLSGVHANSWRQMMHLPRDGASRLERAQRLDIAEWLPNDLLIKLDRCLMAHAIEGRTPLLDPAVAAVAASLSDGLKLRDGKGKYLLRRWLDTNLPGVDAFAPKKGFTVPVGAWIAAEAGRLAPLLAGLDCLAPVAGRARIGRIVARAGRRDGGRGAWHLLFYALWHKIHIERISPDGDIFETLAA